MPTPTPRVLILLALCFFAPLATADEPAPLPLPWQTGPAAPAAPPPAGIPPAPASGSMAELLELVLPTGEAAAFAQKPADVRERIAVREFEQLQQKDPVQHGLLMRRLAFGRASLAETPPGLSARARALVLLGPPLRRHVETGREWSGRTARRFAPEQVKAALEAGAPPASGAAPARAPDAMAVTLSGALPSEAWVYAVPGKADVVRVLWFVDDDRDGTLSLVLDEVVPASIAVSPAPGQVLPADLHAQLGLGSTFADLPEVAKAALPLVLAPSFFQAAEAKTFARVLIVVDPADVEMELDRKPVDFQVAATVALRVAQAGTPLFQRVLAPGKGALVALGKSWGAEFGVPLLPGEYQVTAVVVDAEGHGGRLETNLVVPALSAGLALSTPVLALAEGGGLPKAPEGVNAPFQVGSYLVRPRVPAVFRRGETLALAVQASGALKAHVEFDIYLEGQLQGTFAQVDLDELPATEIQLVDVVPEWPDGSYEIRVIANTPGEPERKVEQRVTFRVHGG